MTLSSSVGWPLNGPIRRVSRAPLASSPEDEGQQQQADPGGRPGVLVATQPGVRADDDGQHADDRDGDEQPQQLDAGQAERVAEGGARLVLGQSLHQQQTQAAEHAERRQQDLVGPPAGQDLGQVRGGQSGQVDGQTGRVGGLDDQRPIGQEGPGRPQGDAAGDQGEPDQDQQAQLAPPEAGTDRPDPESGPGHARGGHPLTTPRAPGGTGPDRPGSRRRRRPRRGRRSGRR